MTALLDTLNFPQCMIPCVRIKRSKRKLSENFSIRALFQVQVLTKDTALRNYKQINKYFGYKSLTSWYQLWINWKLAGGRINDMYLNLILRTHTYVLQAIDTRVSSNHQAIISNLTAAIYSFQFSSPIAKYVTRKRITAKTDIQCKLPRKWLWLDLMMAFEVDEMVHCTEMYY